MIKILEFKESIIRFYMKFEKVILPIGKFLLSFFVLLMVNNFFKANVTLGKIMLMVFISLITVFIPVYWFILILIAFISAQLLALSVEASIIISVFMLAIYILFVRAFPKTAYFIILVPLFFALKIGYIIPIFAGLFIGPTAIFSVCTGALIYKFSMYIPGLLQVQSESVYDMPETIMHMYKYIMDILVQDTSIILTIIIFAVVLIVTHVVSRLEYDHIWYISIGVGITVNMLGFIIGILVLKSEISIVGVILGSLLAGIVCSIAQFMRFSLDYTRAEKVQFEDETYYYFVKAIPKVTISKTEKAITKIK